MPSVFDAVRRSGSVLDVDPGNLVDGKNAGVNGRTSSSFFNGFPPAQVHYGNRRLRFQPPSRAFL